MALKGTISLSEVRKTRPPVKDFEKRVRDAIMDGLDSPVVRKVCKMRGGFSLKELRELLRLTQAALAQRLEIDIPPVSRIENRSDHLVSTIRAYVEALGGKLEIVAVFNGKRVKLRGV